MKAYQDIIHKVLTEGEYFPNRTGIDTIATFGVMFEHDLRYGFPLLTTKKMAQKPIFVELVGFIRGITSKKWFQDRGCFIWDEWCNPQQLLKYDWSDLNKIFTDIKTSIDQMENPPKKLREAVSTISVSPDLKLDVVRKLVQLYEDDLGPIYGFQWRHFGKQHTPVTNPDGSRTIDTWDGVDQLGRLIHTMKTNPHDRRMIVSAWNPIEVENNTLALPPCHWSFEVYSNGKEFDLMWHQRSVDVFLGLPFNIASYAMLMKLLEKETGLTARFLKGSLGNTHVYANHMEQIKEQMARTPLKLPRMTITGEAFNIDTWEPSDYVLDGYEHHPALKGSVAV